MEHTGDGTPMKGKGVDQIDCSILSMRFSEYIFVCNCRKNYEFAILQPLLLFSSINSIYFQTLLFLRTDLLKMQRKTSLTQSTHDPSILDHHSQSYFECRWWGLMPFIFNFLWPDYSTLQHPLVKLDLHIRRRPVLPNALSVLIARATAFAFLGYLQDLQLIVRILSSQDCYLTTWTKATDLSIVIRLHQPFEGRPPKSLWYQTT